jgi:hypothetical protein
MTKCNAPTTDGSPCERKVSGEGEACYQHEELTQDTMSTTRNPITGQTYSDPNSSKTADDIDAEKLYGSPSLSQIRWLYRRQWGKTIVEKPIKDAFKNGFTIMRDTNSSIRNSIHDLDFKKTYQKAQIKARRDGLSLIHYVLEEQRREVNLKNPVEDGDVNKIANLKILTLDDLKTENISEYVIADEFQNFDGENLEVREGQVVNKDTSHPNYGEIIGYILDYNDEPDYQVDPTVLHADRVQRIEYRGAVDGDFETNMRERNGHFDSILTPVYNTLKSVTKGNYALGQILFRYSSNLHVLKEPENLPDKAHEAAEQALTDINVKSSITLPSNDFEMETFSADGNLDPESYFEVLFSQICAGTEMTKSVLFGTQSGTVSGSQTDQQNYFNKVDRLRSNRIRRDMHEFVHKLNRWHNRSPNTDYKIDWNPLFEPSEDSKIEMIRTLSNAGTQFVNSATMTPDEFRNQLLEPQLREMGYDVELEDMTREQLEKLEQINVFQTGREGDLNQFNPNEQNGGGMPEGTSTGSNQPNKN